MKTQTLQPFWQTHKNKITAALVVLCTFFAAVLLFGIRYEVNDDATLSNIAGGAYGADSQYLIYVNILLGFLLKPFYALIPSLNWFVILQLCADLFCLYLLYRCIEQQFGTLKGCLIGTALMIAFGLDLFASFQYVKNAALYLVTGFVLIAKHLGTAKPALFGGIALAVLGSMVRFDNFYAIGGLSAAFLLWHFFRLQPREKLRAAFSMMLLFALVFGTKIIDTAFYQADPVWRDYQAYNDVRTTISDFRLQFLTNPALVAEEGYNINDYWMIENWGYYDPEVFTVEKLQDFADKIPRNSLRRAALETAKTGLRFLYREPMFLFLGLTVLGWLLFADKKNLAAVLGVGGMLGALLFYLCFKGRLPHRVEWSLAFGAAVFILLLCHPNHRPCRRRIFAGGLAVLCLASVVFFAPLWTERQSYAERYPAENPSYDAMSADKEHLYFADILLLDSLAGYDVFHARPKDYFSNIVVTGGWTSGSAFDRNTLQRYGFDNPYRALACDDERVLLADFYFTEIKADYLHDHYGVDGTFEKVGELSPKPFEVYRFVPSFCAENG